MAQVEFVGTFERLAGSWRIGSQPHSRARARPLRENNNTPNGKPAIEAPPERTSSPLPPSPVPVKALLLQAPGTLLDPLSLSTSSSASHSALVWVPPTPLPSPAPTLYRNIDPGESLDCARIILAPIAECGTECAREAEAHVVALVALDLVCLFRMR